MYAEDSRDMVQRIMGQAEDKGEEIPMDDGFDLYKELSEVRRVHTQAIPGYVSASPLSQRGTELVANTVSHSDPFPFPLEQTLASFVWRWIEATSEKITGWAEEAVKQDNFKVQTESPDDIPTDEQRHSVSVVDIFRSLKQVINQIVELNWDDDVGYAKFMTTLSKAIGLGLGRYCEILEQMFSKEMDRLSPEQEASARQTKQEKWMQMAKEAWINKEKIEPFHFFPEVSALPIQCWSHLSQHGLTPGASSLAVVCQAQQHRIRHPAARQA
jgi:hypothetical protein